MVKRVLILFCCLLLSGISLADKKVKAIPGGTYEAYNKYNTTYFIETPGGMTPALKNRLAAMTSHKVKARRTLRKKTKVQVLTTQVYTRQEKRVPVIRHDGEKIYYGKSSKQIWKYGVAKIKVKTGKHRGKTGWMIYGREKIANKDGSKPKRSYFTSYLRKPKPKKK